MDVPVTQDRRDVPHPDSVVNIHKKILKDAGLEHLRFHDLRHTFATLALQNGVDVKTVSVCLDTSTRDSR
ncbi:MAG: tyrosine-type recombinase/integrase [Oscillospiraceae bacterium]